MIITNNNSGNQRGGSQMNRVKIKHPGLKMSFLLQSGKIIMI